MSEVSASPKQVEAPIARSPRSGVRRVALLGAGYIADWHAQALRSVDDVELVAVCDRAVGKAQGLAQKFGIPKVYASLEEMLAAEQSEGLDAVHVLTPPDRHYESAKAVLEAGVGVFLEKPMCENAEDCDALVQLAAEKNLPLGVGHNFLFAEIYEQLRQDVKSGALGLIDDVVITWHRPLPQALFGPFDTWMLREPCNILVEVGSHSVAHMLDLVGEPEELEVKASNPIDLPTEKQFFRRWHVNSMKGRTAVELRFSFVPGFSEYTIHVRGSLGAATVDFDRNTYIRDEHTPSDPDFETHGMLIARAKSLKKQAGRTLGKYIKAKLKIEKRGNPYGASIARAMDAFYAANGSLPLDERVDGRMGAEVIRVCARMTEAVELPLVEAKALPVEAALRPASEPKILVLGGTGFIGKELLRQLVAGGYQVRALVRSKAAIPAELRASANLQLAIGDLSNKQDLLQAMEGIETVFHLARANVKTWAEYEQYEIEATRRVGEFALACQVKRLIYTGTIDSYYCGAGTITEATPLDPDIASRNLYARAKAVSEGILIQMKRQHGLPLVIVRPGIVIGRGGSPYHWGVGMWWSESVCQIWGEGNNKLGLVLVEDVASGLIAAMNTPGIEGQAFNLVGDPLLTAHEYLDALDAAGGIRIQRHATPISRFYLQDMKKWVVKVAVGHKDRRLPSYRDWESRTGKATFDCSVTKKVLGWTPVADRDGLIEAGIAEPVREFLK